jgi:hypothetical protein
MFNFVITDIESIMIFDCSRCFNGFNNEIFNKRIAAKDEGNDIKQMFYKMILNSSWGYDGLNTEKYKDTQCVCNTKKFGFYVKQKKFLYGYEIRDGIFCAGMAKDRVKCQTCLQESVFTLDNSKVWYLTFLYKFLFKCVDKYRMHFNHCDTDSFYISVSGKPYFTEEDMVKINDTTIAVSDGKKYSRDDALKQRLTQLYDTYKSAGDGQSIGYDQGIDAIITNRKYYDKFKDLWLPKNKTLLSVAIEERGDSEIDLAPKSYTVYRTDMVPIIRLKGYNGKDISFQDFEDQIKGAAPLYKNVVQMNSKVASVVKNYSRKIALSATMDKAVVQNDFSGSCIPFYSPIDESVNVSL